MAVRESDAPLGELVGESTADAAGGPVAERSNGRSGPSRSQRRKQTRASRRLTRGVVRKIDLWSVLKLSVVFYLALYGILLVAAVLLWTAATTTGLRGNVESFVADMIASGQFHFVASELFRAGAVGGAILVVLGTGANVMLAVLYNLISQTVGGLTVVVEERPTARAVQEEAFPARQPVIRQVRERAKVAEPEPEPEPEPVPKPEPEPVRILIPEAEIRQSHRPRPSSTPEPSGL